MAGLRDGYQGVRNRVAMGVDHLHGQVALPEFLDPLVGLAGHRVVPVAQKLPIFGGRERHGLVGPLRGNDREIREVKVPVLAVREIVVLETDAHRVRAGRNGGRKGVRGPLRRADLRFENLAVIEADFQLGPGAAGRLAARHDDEGAGRGVQKSERAGRRAVLPQAADVARDASLRNFAEVRRADRHRIRGCRGADQDDKQDAAICIRVLSMKIS